MTVSIMLRRVGADQTTPTSPTSGRPLEGTYWKAIEFVGKPMPAQDAKREVHLMFQEGRLSGQTGATDHGTYQLQGDAVTFGHLAGTRMACVVRQPKSSGHFGMQ